MGGYMAISEPRPVSTAEKGAGTHGVALVVTTDNDSATELDYALRRLGYRAQVSQSFTLGLERLSERTYDVIVVYMRTWDRPVADFIRTARMLQPKQPIVLVGSRRQVRKGLTQVGLPRFFPLTGARVDKAIEQALGSSEGLLSRVQYDALYSLLDAARMAVENVELSALTDTMLPVIARIGEASRVVLYVRPPDADGLRVAAAFPPEPNGSDEAQQASGAIAAASLDAGGPFTATLGGVNLEVDHELNTREASRAVALPLVYQNQAVGVLTLFFESEDEDPQGLEQVEDLGHYLAVVVRADQLKDTNISLEGAAAQYQEEAELRRREVQSLNRMLQSHLASVEEAEEKLNGLSAAQERLMRTIGTLVGRRTESGVPPERVRAWLMAVAESLELEDPSIGELAYLHDIGTLVPEAESHELHGGGEAAESGRHAALGAELLSQLDFPQAIVAAVRHHHENFDGSGQPDGLTEEAIPIGSRILRVLDGYLGTGGRELDPGDAAQARDFLIRETGRAFDPKIVGAFLEILDQERPEQSAENQVISTISHELRSPLTYLLGYSELLAQQRDLPKDAAERAQELRDEAVHMSRLLEQLLEISRLEGGSRIAQDDLDLDALLGRVVKRLSKFSENFEILYKSTGEPAMVRGDDVRLVEAIDNLLDNAMKYSPNGGLIEVVLGHAQEHYQISVSDQGIGIPADALDKLFNKFYRVDGPMADTIRGTGLGLNLVKGIVEAHGGTIWVESEEGKGSTFFFTIPLATSVER